MPEMEIKFELLLQKKNLSNQSRLYGEDMSKFSWPMFGTRAGFVKEVKNPLFGAQNSTDHWGPGFAIRSKVYMVSSTSR